MEPETSLTSEALRRRATEILAGRDYAVDRAPSDDSWTLALMLEILDWILAPFRWIYHLSEGLPDVLRWLIVVACAVLSVLLIAHIIYTIAAAVRKPKRAKELDQASRRSSSDPAELERLADEALQAGNSILAIRFLFQACLVRLEQADQRRNRPGTTNRELLRRYRTRPTVEVPLRRLVDIIDRKWYGDEPCLPADVADSQQAHQHVCRAIAEVTHAVRA